MPAILNLPVTDDGKLLISPTIFPDSTIPIYIGCSDDVTNGVRFGGSTFTMSATSIGTTTHEFQFIDWVYLAGGGLSFSGGVLGDYVSYSLYAPSSDPAETFNEGAGDYAKLAIGGGVNMYVNPATPGAGDPDWDLDLESTLNANVDFTLVVPVTSEDDDGNGTGFFNWDADTNAVTYAPAMNGHHNLFDADIPLLGYIHKYCLLSGSSVCCEELYRDAVKPRRVLPHWVHKVSLYNSSTKTGSGLQLSWKLFLGRVNTI